MVNISYYYSKSGEEIGKWPGTSGWTEKGARKEGQMALGKVISKEKLIFYKRGEGYYRFDPTDQTCHDIPLEELPLCLEQTDKRHIRTPVIVVFGGSYFLHRLVKEIRYLPVLDSIEYGNADRLHSICFCQRINPGLKLCLHSLKFVFSFSPIANGSKSGVKNA